MVDQQEGGQCWNAVLRIERKSSANTFSQGIAKTACVEIYLVCSYSTFESKVWSVESSVPSTEGSDKQEVVGLSSVVSSIGCRHIDCSSKNICLT